MICDFFVANGGETLGVRCVGEDSRVLVDRMWEVERKVGSCGRGYELSSLVGLKGWRCTDWTIS